MENNDITNAIAIRTAQISDAKELLALYTPYVENTAITFEYDVPTLEEFVKRMETVMKKYPYIVAKKNGEILGYAYAGQFKSRAAYEWSVETSIYIRQDSKRMGIGRMLYDELEKRLKAQGIKNLYACIAYTEEKDEHLTNDSVYYHKKLGYTLIGHFHKCGYKYDHWYDMVWMEKFIGEHV